LFWPSEWALLGQLALFYVWVVSLFAILPSWVCFASEVLEIVGPEYREVIGVSVQLGWAAGYLSLPGVAYVLRDFRRLLLCCAALQFAQLVLYFALSESPRWLLANDRFDQARKLLKHAAKVNRRMHLVDIDTEVWAIQRKSVGVSVNFGEMNC